MENGRHFDTDLVVIGAGPAGSSAAIWGALQGLSVVLVESRTFPRSLPGETLHPGVEVLFRQLGVQKEIVEASATRPMGINVESPYGVRFIPYGHDNRGTWKGYQIPRAVLDQILLRRAIEVGVNVLQPCVANEPIIESGHVLGIETSKGPIRSRFVLDAAGSAHWLSRRLSIPIQCNSNKLIARFGYAQGNLTCSISELPLFRADEFGWTWMTRISDSRYHWTRLCSSSSTGPFLPSEFDQLDMIGKVKGRDVTWRLLDCVASPGYFIAGDAASTFDPSSGKGVLRGLYSGILASHLIANILKGAIQSEIGFEHYNKTMREWFCYESIRLRQYYHVLGIGFKLLGEESTNILTARQHRLRLQKETSTPWR